MPTPAQSLFDEAKCYVCFGADTSQALTLTLYARWLTSLNPEADTSPPALLSYGSCFACYGGGNAFDIMETSLLDQISTAL